MFAAVRSGMSAINSLSIGTSKSLASAARAEQLGGGASSIMVIKLLTEKSVTAVGGLVGADVGDRVGGL